MSRKVTLERKYGQECESTTAPRPKMSEHSGRIVCVVSFRPPSPYDDLLMYLNMSQYEWWPTYTPPTNPPPLANKPGQIHELIFLGKKYIPFAKPISEGIVHHIATREGVIGHSLPSQNSREWCVEGDGFGESVWCLGRPRTTVSDNRSTNVRKGIIIFEEIDTRHDIRDAFPQDKEILVLKEQIDIPEGVMYDPPRVKDTHKTIRTWEDSTRALRALTEIHTKLVQRSELTARIELLDAEYKDHLFNLTKLQERIQKEDVISPYPDDPYRRKGPNSDFDSLQRQMCAARNERDALIKEKEELRKTIPEEYRSRS